jgi:hypothetical protein
MTEESKDSDIITGMDSSFKQIIASKKARFTDKTGSKLGAPLFCPKKGTHPFVELNLS